MMNNKVLIVLGAFATVVTTGALGSSSAIRPDHQSTIEFKLNLEVNSSDQDAEVVLYVKSDEAIDRFILFDPFFHPILTLASNDGEDLGLSEILLESAEPSIPEVLAAYPAGPYFGFFRTTAGAGALVPTFLSHDLPQMPVITAPAAGVPVGASSAVLSWARDPAVESWVIEIENDDLGRALTLTVPGNVHNFAVPRGFLVPGEEFEIGIAAIGADGNIVVTESMLDVL